MKITVVSDTHFGYKPYFQKEFINEAETSDMIIHCGDFAAVEIYNELLQYTNVEAVYGNTDDYSLREILTPKKIIKIKNFSVGIVHGWGEPYSLHQRIPNAFADSIIPDIIIYGHSHIFTNKIIDFQSKKIRCLNPGSYSRSRRGENSFAVLKIDDSGVIDFERKIGIT